MFRCYFPLVCEQVSKRPSEVREKPLPGFGNLIEKALTQVWKRNYVTLTVAVNTPQGQSFLACKKLFAFQRQRLFLQ